MTNLNLNPQSVLTQLSWLGNIRAALKRCGIHIKCMNVSAENMYINQSGELFLQFRPNVKTKDNIEVMHESGTTVHYGTINIEGIALKDWRIN